MKLIRLILSIILISLISSIGYCAVDLDGTDDKIQTNGLVSELASDTVGTFSVWVLLTDDGSGHCMFSVSRTADGTNTALEILFKTGASNDYLRAEVRVDGTTQWRMNGDVDSTDAIIGTWTNVIIVQNATEIVYYYDNVSQNTNFETSTDKTLWFKAILTDATSDSDTSAIGLHQTGGGSYDQFTGQMTEMYIYDKVLSATERATLAGSREKWIGTHFSGLQAYYPMDDQTAGTAGDGETARDQSGNGNDGTLDDGANNTGMGWTGETVLSYPGDVLTGF